MKKIILLGSFAVIALMSFTKIEEPKTKNSKTENKVILKSKFDEGFEDGYCEGWKDVKGAYSVYPVAPVPPVPNAFQSYNSYKDGYNTGFKAGRKAAQKN